MITTITTAITTMTSGDPSVTSVSLIGGELQPERFFQWVNDVTQQQGPDILRLKGILAFKGDKERYVLQGVHMIVEGDHQRAWRDDEPRISKLVFIGRKLDADQLRAGFDSTRAK
jgi:G3E family GTPase